MSFYTRFKEITAVGKFLVIVGVAFWVSTSLALAATIDEQINAKQQEVDNTKNQITSKQQEAVSLKARVGELDQEMANLKTQLAKTRDDITTTNDQIEKITARIAEQRQVLKGLIQEEYQNDQVQPIAIMAALGTLSEFVDRQQYVLSFKSKTTAALADIKQTQAELNDQKAQLAKQEADLKGQQTLTEQAKTQQQQLLDATQGEEEKYKALLDGQVDQLSNLYALRAAAHATTGGTGNYPAKWHDAPQDSMVDDWFYYNRECVSYVAWKRASVGSPTPGYGNAGNWPVNSSTPSVGSVAVWGYSIGAFGHVGYVEAVNADGSILISQYNWDLRGEYSTMTVSPGSAYWPSKGFLN